MVVDEATRGSHQFGGSAFRLVRTVTTRTLFTQRIRSLMQRSMHFTVTLVVMFILFLFYFYVVAVVFRLSVSRFPAKFGGFAC